MNKLFIIGNLTTDPELRTTPNGVSVCTMNVAVNRRYSGSNGERTTDFFRVTAWRQLGELCSRYLAKGRKISVVGEVTARAYTAKDGSPRASLEITADEIEFLTPRGDQGGLGYQSAQGYQPAQGYQSAQGGYHQGYPQQGFQQNAAKQPSNSWQDNAQQNGMDSNPFGGDESASSGFEEITDNDLPF